jgi:glycosyltransferase involved in cell wall biosynthesis
MGKAKGTLVILTFNEIEGLREIFPLIPLDKIEEVFVIDGGSKDGTLEFFKKNKMKVILQKIKGRGEAFRIAFREAKFDNLVFFSPDGNENPRDILKSFYYLDKGYDLVIASRFMKGARCDEDDQWIRLRKFGNKTFTKIANLLFGGKLTDSINGFRGIKRKSWMELNPDAQHFGIEFQTSIRAMKKKMKILEFPTMEKERIGGESTARSFKVGWDFIKLLKNEFFRK